ncbi:hypothetical protein Tco_0335490 [Tanacetum coccineum]
MPSHIKTYDGSEDPEDHLKIFQAASLVRWTSSEFVDSYEDLRDAFRENYLQQKKCIKDLVEIHHIKQRDGESMKDFVERYKIEIKDVEGAPEWEVASSSHGRKKSLLPWKKRDAGDKQNFKKRGLQHRRMHATKKTNQGDDQGRKAITRYQRTKVKRPAKSGQKRRSLWKRQPVGDLDGTTMEKGSGQRRHGTLNFLMDELHARKVAISIQWNHWQTRSKKDSIRPINSLWNVKGPGRRRSGSTINKHKLNVQEGCLPVRQKKRGQALERNKAIQDEVEKLVDVGIMKEVHYHMWLSNPVMVKKHDLENVYRFQRFEQSMPQRRISAARNRLEGRIPLRISFQKLPRRIQGISSNKDDKRG